MTPVKAKAVKKKTATSIKPQAAATGDMSVLMKKLGVDNALALPRLVKVVVNAGVGRVRKDEKKLEAAKRDLAIITGQKPAERLAKKSISSFSLREGDVVGLVVTLRGSRMHDFLRRLISVALPRTRDFRGLNLRGFDGSGNYTLGVKEHTVFAEINPELTPHVFGLEISLVTTAADNNAATLLFEALGVPIQKDKAANEPKG